MSFVEFQQSAGEWGAWLWEWLAKAFENQQYNIFGAIVVALILGVFAVARAVARG
jgi:hypothetical protein